MIDKHQIVLGCSSASGAGSAGRQASEWYRNLDITLSDLPYLEPLMIESLADWKEECRAVSAGDAAAWAVVCPDGSWALGDPSLLEYLSAGDDRALNEAIQQGTVALTSSPDRLGGSLVCAVPIFSRIHGDLFAVIVGVSSPGTNEQHTRLSAEFAAVLFKSCFYRRFEYIFIADLSAVHDQAAREVRQRSVLAQYVKTMHAQINVDGVLNEILNSTAELLPAAEVYLYMSQDHQSSHPSVRPLLLHHWQQDIYVRTFMEGTLTVRRNPESEMEPAVEVGVPVGGKQGVYGVLYLGLTEEAMNGVDLELLEMMADAAGTAFENAKLYEQSNLMIHELRMINELTQQLNKSLSLVDIYSFANQELRKILGAEYCCILCSSEELGGLEVVSCNAAWLAKEVFEKGYGLGGLVYHTKEPLILGDYFVESPAVSKLMVSTGSNSLIATPLIVNAEVRGAILLTHSNKHYFSYDHYRLLQALTSHIGLAVGNATLHAEVRRMANRDMLTELYARHYLDEAIHEAQNRDFCGSLIVVDIDQFKQVNDTYGHQKGDKILKQVSGIIKSSIRQSDIAARWGGEELAVYLPGLTNKHSIQVAERIRRRVAEETQPQVTVSCGVSEWDWTHDRISVESLFYRADMALYEAKNSGRNRIVMDRVVTAE